VVFTLKLIKQYPAIDNNGIGSSIQDVTAPDPQTVDVTLTSPNSSLLWFLGGQTFIVSQHIWSGVGDPSKYTDTTPIGTGPFVFKSFTPQLIDFTKNPRYWQPGKPVVPEIRYPAFNGNTTAELAMNSDQTDWNGLYTPNVSKTFVARDKTHNHYFFAPSDPVMLFLNLTKAPFNQLTVRKAISFAIDRAKLSSVGESGYEPVAHPTGIILPAGKQFLDPAYATSAFAHDPSQATQLMASAGYTKGSDGILVGPGGKKLSVNLDVVSGYTDWISDCQIIADNLKAIGIQVNVTQDQFGQFFQNLQNGSYDMSIWGETPGPTPYYIYDEVLASGNSAPIGQAANTNFERWSDPATDALLAQYNNTIDLAQQKQAMSGIEKIVVEQVPVVFLMNEPYWYEYNTLKYVGWPDQNHPYAEASPYTYPDDEIVLLNLHQ
jgi:peptide/nickel transport system substrate-binding protein